MKTLLDVLKAEGRVETKEDEAIVITLEVRCKVCNMSLYGINAFADDNYIYCKDCANAKA